MNLNSRAAFLSGREDLNLRPLQPHCSALAGLRYAPNSAVIITERSRFDKHSPLALVARGASAQSTCGTLDWYNHCMSDDPSPSAYAPFIALAVVLALFVLALVGLLVGALMVLGLNPAAPAARRRRRSSKRPRSIGWPSSPTITSIPSIPTVLIASISLAPGPCPPPPSSGRTMGSA